MTIKRRTKNSRHRGSKTHSWGAMKKHRGAGNKGGRGNAGTGKRSDCKKPSVWGIEHFYGKHGFTPIGGIRRIVVCNIETVERSYHKLLKQGIIKEENGVYIVDLEQLGYEKLLGKGKPTKKWNIIIPRASATAVEKIKEKGGNVIVRESVEASAEEGA